jgi:hypothetical protein
VRNILDRTGFEHILITRKDNSEEIIEGWNVAPGAEQLVFSAYIRASKPLSKGAGALKIND